MAAPHAPAGPFAATSPEVRGYRRVQRARRALNERLIKTVPDEAFDEISELLGFLRTGTFALPYPDAAHVLMDCCVHDWVGDDGRTLVQSFAARVAAGEVRLPEAEQPLLDAWAGARPALLRVDEQWPGAGGLVHDALEGRASSRMHRFL